MLLTRWYYAAFGPLLATAALLAACRPAPLAVPLPDTWQASAAALALRPDGSLLAAVNPDSDSVTLVEPATMRTPRVLAELPVGDDPRTLAFTPDGALLLVANHGGGSLTIIDVARQAVSGSIELGGQPYGVVADSRQAYVSLLGRAQLAVVDLQTRAVTARVDTPPFPAGLALDRPRSWLYVTHLRSGQVSRLDLRSLEIEPAAALGADAGLAQFILLSPDGTRAYLPFTRSNHANLNLGYDTTILPAVAVLDLPGGAAQHLDLARLDRPVNLPFAAALSPDGAVLYVVHAGSDDLSVIDLASGQTPAHWETGRNPRGLALSADGRRLFVNNTLDGTLLVLDTTSGRVESVLTLTQIPLPEPLLTGKRLFHSSRPPLSRDHWVSCASCHPDGGSDGRTWAGFPDGPRDTPALFGAAQTLPLHWGGELDELQDVELTIRLIQHGAGLAAALDEITPQTRLAGRSVELDALAAYIASLGQPASPHAVEASAGALERGQRAFNRWGCAVCHPAPLFTDQRIHATRIGNAARERGSPGLDFDTPSLLGAWATAPYFHDGSAATLRDTLFGPGFHGMGYAMNQDEIDDLITFLKSLPAAP